jgi:hypothetical protein
LFTPGKNRDSTDWQSSQIVGLFLRRWGYQASEKLGELVQQQLARQTLESLEAKEDRVPLSPLLEKREQLSVLLRQRFPS